MRIALCHEWLTTYGGSDLVASRIAKVLAIKDVFAFAVDPDLARRLFPASNVRAAHRIGHTDFARRHWQWLLPAMPLAWSRLDLSSYDLIVTSSHCCVNSIRPAGSPVVSYCHTPVRYGWDHRTERGRLPLALRPLWPAAAAVLRTADRRWSRNVSSFIANSRHVATRISKYYDRDSEVIYPPVDVEYWKPSESVEKDDFFLYAGRLVHYKRPDLVVEATRRARVPLVIAGDGPELHRLQSIAHQDVRFITEASNEQLRDLYRRARALIFAGIEDFGMTLVEAQACGTPVVALAAGGALESVVDGVTGSLYPDPSPDSLAEVISRFDEKEFSPTAVRRNVDRFSLETFDRLLRASIARHSGAMY